MSNPLNTSPYTVTNHCGVIFISLNGVEHGTVSAERAGVNLEALLNAAYLKGVEDERARRAAEYVRESFCMDDEEDDTFGVDSGESLLNPLERAVALLIATYGFTPEIANRLIMKVGINSPAAFEGVEVRDLTQDNVFTQAEAEDIIRKVNPS